MNIRTYKRGLTTFVNSRAFENEDVVEEMLENRFEFLQQQNVCGAIRYSLYDSSFRKWLSKQVYVKTFANVQLS